MKLIAAVRNRITRDGVLELSFFAGVLLVASGAAIVYLPAGLILGGLLVSACAYLELQVGRNKPK